MRISRECVPVVGIEIVLMVPACYLAVTAGGFTTMAVSFLSFVLLAGTLLFFRDPERRIPEGGDVVVAPADGRIVEILKEKENQFCEKEMLRISIFLSILDVHINRMPVSGKVKFITYTPGRFIYAASPKASIYNEQTMIGVETENGTKFVVKQIAGLVARRIVCRLKVNDELSAGEKFGMIKFGSRTDLFLPPKTRLSVSVGDKVYAGSSIIGSLNHDK